MGKDTEDLQEVDIQTGIQKSECFAATQKNERGGGIDMCEALTTLIEEGKAEGRVEGIELGKLEGENSFAMLTEHLLQQNRTDDLLQAINDIDYRKILYREFEIK